jgi:hypothetical protein
MRNWRHRRRLPASSNSKMPQLRNRTGLALHA